MFSVKGINSKASYLENTLFLQKFLSFRAATCAAAWIVLVTNTLAEHISQFRKTELMSKCLMLQFSNSSLGLALSYLFMDLWFLSILDTCVANVAIPTQQASLVLIYRRGIPEKIDHQPFRLQNWHYAAIDHNHDLYTMKKAHVLWIQTSYAHIFIGWGGTFEAV